MKHTHEIRALLHNYTCVCTSFPSISLSYQTANANLFQHKLFYIALNIYFYVVIIMKCLCTPPVYFSILTMCLCAFQQDCMDLGKLPYGYSRLLLFCQH